MEKLFLRIQITQNNSFAIKATETKKYIISSIDNPIERITNFQWVAKPNTVLIAAGDYNNTRFFYQNLAYNNILAEI